RAFGLGSGASRTVASRVPHTETGSSGRGLTEESVWPVVAEGKVVGRSVARSAGCAAGSGTERSRRPTAGGGAARRALPGANPRPVRPTATIGVRAVESRRPGGEDTAGSNRAATARPPPSATDSDGGVTA